MRRLAPMMVLGYLASASFSGQTPTYRAGASGVRLDVSVFDGPRPVSGLRANQFEVLDAGVRQQAQALETRDAPLDVILLAPPAPSLTPDRLITVRQSVGVLAGLLRPADRLGIVIGSAGPRVVRALAAVDDAASALSSDGTAATALRDAMLQSLLLFDGADRRKVLIVLTDGQRDRSWLTPDQIQRAVRRLPAQVIIAGLDSTANGNGLVLSNDGFGVREDWFAFGRGRRLVLPRWLADVARSTGGRVLDLRENDAGDRLAALVGALRSQYLVTYTPTGVAASGWHPIVMRLKGAKGTVVTRAGYWG